MVYNKKWYESKTVWAAVASALIAVAGAVLGDTHPIVTVGVAVASSFGIYGRFVAQGPLK